MNTERLKHMPQCSATDLSALCNSSNSVSVGEVKLWEYRYVFVLCPFYIGYMAH